MGQQWAEKVSAYTAQLNGQAELCDYLVDCPSCEAQVSYKEKTVMYQVVRGLEDRDMQERVLQAAAQVEGGEMSLTRVIKLCEALEMGKFSQDIFHNSSGSINRVSVYQRKKARSKQAGKSGGKPAPTAESKSCGNCGSPQHSSKLQDRRKKCKAFHETCNKCGVIGHFKAQCRGQGKPKDGAKLTSKVGGVSAETKQGAEE